MTEKGSVFGAILLIASCCIGAGMLGLPVITAEAGFKPSLIFFIASWLFMTITGLLLLEVNLWCGEHTSIMTMAKRTLGPIGEIFAFFIFIFLFYSIMVAYVAAGGGLVVDFIGEITPFQFPSWIGSLALVLFFGIFVYLGTASVDKCNRLLMVALITSYVIMIGLGLPHIDVNLLSYTNWSASLFILPPMIISFGFHNLVPTLTTYLGGNLNRMRIAIVVGALIPLIIYLLWEALILGIIPVEGATHFQTALDEGEMVTRTLKNVVGSSWVVHLAQTFAFFAIVTSFLGVATSFVDFLADGFKIKRTVLGQGAVSALVMIPPFLFGIFYPGMFFTALNYAGGFAAVILFGIMPALMVWSARKTYSSEQKAIVPGGKLLLVLVIAFALFVITMQGIHEIKG